MELSINPVAKLSIHNSTILTESSSDATHWISAISETEEDSVGDIMATLGGDVSLLSSQAKAMRHTNIKPFLFTPLN